MMGKGDTRGGAKAVSFTEKKKKKGRTGTGNRGFSAGEKDGRTDEQGQEAALGCGFWGGGGGGCVVWGVENTGETPNPLGGRRIKTRRQSLEAGLGARKPEKKKKSRLRGEREKGSLKRKGKGKISNESPRNVGESRPR